MEEENQRRRMRCLIEQQNRDLLLRKSQIIEENKSEQVGQHFCAAQCEYLPVLLI